MGKRKSNRIVVLIALGLGLALIAGCTARSTTAMGWSTIIINAPPEKVWAYITDLGNAKEFISVRNEITDLEGSGLGMTFRWKAEVGPLTMTGKGVCVDHVPFQRAAIMETSDGKDVDVKYTAILVPLQQGTKMIQIWELSVKLPRGISSDTLKKGFQKGMDESLKRIKAAVEKK